VNEKFYVGIIKEAKFLEKEGYEYVDGLPDKWDSVICIVADTRKKHDSGYPFIRCFAENEKKLYDLGWHDHFCQSPKVMSGYNKKIGDCVQWNIDALGKNIFRVMSWGNNGRKVFHLSGSRPLFCSTLDMDEEGGWE